MDVSQRIESNLGIRWRAVSFVSSFLYLNWLTFTSITLGIRQPTTHAAAATYFYGVLPRHSTAICLSLPKLLRGPHLFLEKVARTHFPQILPRPGSGGERNNKKNKEVILRVLFIPSSIWRRAELLSGRRNIMRVIHQTLRMTSVSFSLCIYQYNKFRGLGGSSIGLNLSPKRSPK